MFNQELEADVNWWLNEEMTFFEPIEVAAHEYKSMMGKVARGKQLKYKEEIKRKEEQSAF